jgi:hypothetical protein
MSWSLPPPREAFSAEVFRHVLAEHTLVTGEVVLRELRRVLRQKLPPRTVDSIER